MNFVEIKIPRPDDCHLHLRDGAVLSELVWHTSRRFARAIIMPNLMPPITTTAQAVAYRLRILAALPQKCDFQPLLTLFLTDHTDPAEIIRAQASGIISAIKLYPMGATTNAAHGVTDLAKVFPVFEKMQAIGMPLSIHGEVTDPVVDLFEREKIFIERYLIDLIIKFPELKIVLEHVTTAEAVTFVRNGPINLAATITPHHLLYNRNAWLAHGMRPEYYCLPVLKSERHRKALIAAAISGNPRFFLGTDSAPHARVAKEQVGGRAGIFNAHAALELYAEVFEQAGALDKLAGFASWYGADFYQLKRNQGIICLRRESWRVPANYPFGSERVVPLRAGEAIAWRIIN